MNEYSLAIEAAMAAIEAAADKEGLSPMEAMRAAIKASVDKNGGLGLMARATAAISVDKKGGLGLGNKTRPHLKNGGRPPIHRRKQVLRCF